MVHYKNLNGNSGVSAYELGSGFIKVKFTDGSVYLYTIASAGSNNIERMSQLANLGRGLNTFIMRNVKKRYASKN